MDSSNLDGHPLGFYIKLILLSWFSMIGFDFFLHAGLLPSIYSQPSPFLLPPERAFALIPVGYASFLLFDIFLLWLILKLNIKGFKEGLLFGLKVGLFTWGSFAIGLFSIATASPTLLIAWFLGQAIELGIAGGIIGYGLYQKSLRRLIYFVIVFVIVSIVVSIVIQNITWQ